MKLLSHQTFQLIACSLLLAACQKKIVVQKTETKQFIFTADVKEEDASLDTFLKLYRDSLKEKVGQVLVYSEKELTKGQSNRDQTPAMLAMGNFMTDACFEIAKQQSKLLNLPQPNLSIFTWGSVRKSLSAGNITVNDMYELMPFENEMFLLKLEGKHVKTLLDRLADRNEMIAGATIIKGNPNQIIINGNPFDENKFYYVIASDYLALGGDNLSVMKEASEQFMFNIKVRDALIQYLKALHASGQTLQPNYEQRIR